MMWVMMMMMMMTMMMTMTMMHSGPDQTLPVTPRTSAATIKPFETSAAKTPPVAVQLLEREVERGIEQGKMQSHCSL